MNFTFYLPANTKFSTAHAPFIKLQRWQHYLVTGVKLANGVSPVSLGFPSHNRVSISVRSHRCFVSRQSHFSDLIFPILVEGGPGQLSRYSDSLQAGQSGDQIPVGARFSTPVQTGPGPNPASYKMGTASFPGV